MCLFFKQEIDALEAKIILSILGYPNLVKIVKTQTGELKNYDAKRYCINRLAKIEKSFIEFMRIREYKGSRN